MRMSALVASKIHLNRTRLSLSLLILVFSVLFFGFWSVILCGRVWKVGSMSRSNSPIFISDTELEDSYERSPRNSNVLEILESPVKIVKAPCYR